MTFRDKKKNETQLLQRERLILDATEAVASVMNQQNVTRAELARRLDKSPGFVSQVLDGRRNMTLKTLADIGTALEVGFEVDPRPIGPVKPNAVAVTPQPNPMRLGQLEVRPALSRKPDCWARLHATQQAGRSRGRAVDLDPVDADLGA